MKHDHPRFGSPIQRFLSYGVPLRACGLVILSASVAVAAQQEPSYNGRPLSEWLGDIRLELRISGPEPYQQAIRAIGTNSIPTLLKWISYERSGSQQSSQTGEPVEHPRPKHNLNPEALAERTLYAFRALGAVARPAIPELTRLARASSDPERAQRCTASLADIGPEAIPSLLSLATNGPPWTRYWAVNELEYFAREPEGVQAMPVLIRCLGDTETSYPVAGSAQRVLLSMGPAVAIPALTNALQSPLTRTRLEAANCLLAFVDVADPVLPKQVPIMVPALRAAMRDPDYQVRVIATNVLRRLGGWELVGGQWVRGHRTNTLYGITPDFFTNPPAR